MAGQRGTGDPGDIQHRIRQARAGLLGGRGPGATADEVSRWQRDRPMLGGQPAAAARQEVADQNILARGDPDELEHLIVRRRARLAASLGTLAGQLHERRARTGAALRFAGLAALASAAAGAAVALTVAAARRGHDRT